MKKREFFFGVISVFFFVAFSCKNSSSHGLGIEVDTEAPILRILSPQAHNYVPKNFSLSGSVKDNQGVEKIIVEYSYTVVENQKEEKKSGQKEITPQGENWTCELSIEDDADLDITVTAIDKNKNQGVDSAQNISLVIDSTAPEISNVMIKRGFEGSISVSLNGEKSLKKYVLEGRESSTKDFFQNEEFSISAQITDNYKIKDVSLSLFDGAKEIISNKPKDESSTNSFPVWTITREELEKIDQKYKENAHYFLVKITVTDDATNKTSRVAFKDERIFVWEEQRAVIIPYVADENQNVNKSNPQEKSARGETEIAKYLCWWPESDEAGVNFPLLSGDEMNVSKSTKIPYSIFDDDGIEKVLVGKILKSEWDTAQGKSNEEKIQKFIAADENNAQKIFSVQNVASSDGKSQTRDLSGEIESGDVSGVYMMALAVLDKKSVKNSEGKVREGIWKYECAKLNVDSKDRPIIIIESPKENESAALQNNSFKISGYLLDDKNVTQLAIAWLPEGNSQKSQAESLLEAYDFSADKIDSETGIKIKKLSLTSSGEELGKKKDAFSCDFNVLEFFKDKSGTLINENKVFLIFARDSDGNVSQKYFRLGSYKKPPSVEIKYKSSNADDYIPLKNSLVSVAGNALFLKVLPKAQSNLSIKSFTGKYTDSNNTETQFSNLNLQNETEINQISGSDRIEIEFTIEDSLLNLATQRHTILFAQKASLVSLSTSYGSDRILLKGEILEIQANFSGVVSSVNGTPKIKLTGIKDENGSDVTAFAEYYSGRGTDTLLFRYEIPSGVKSDGVSSPTENPPFTYEGGANIDATMNAVSSIENVKIDAIIPKLSATPSDHSPEQNAVLSSGRTIEVAFTEPIFAESGTVTVQRTAGWAIPPVISEETFTKIYANVSNKDKITLIGSADGNPVLKPNCATPKGPYQKTTHGIKWEGGNAVPDTSTKYVLAFDYENESDLDIFATTGKVQEIREVLERYGYHKSEFDISECEIADNKLKITIPEDDELLVFGREFEVLISEGAVRDKAGNTNEEVLGGAYKFWTQKVATPVIRVDRYSHGAGAKEPDANGALGPLLTRNTAQTTAPTGFVRVKIDCETPGVQIKYDKSLFKESASAKENPPAQRSGGEGKTENLSCDDAAKTELETLTASTTYSGIFSVGSESLEKSGKFYIKASATKATQNGEPALIESGVSYEAAYKTLFYSKNPNGTPNILVVQGSSDRGEPLISGFPLRDAAGDARYEREMYKKTEGSDHIYVTVSYEIVSAFRTQTVANGRWSKGEDDFEHCKYGRVIYNDNRQFY